METGERFQCGIFTSEERQPKETQRKGNQKKLRERQPKETQRKGNQKKLRGKATKRNSEERQPKETQRKGNQKKLRGKATKRNSEERQPKEITCICIRIHYTGDLKSLLHTNNINTTCSGKSDHSHRKQKVFNKF